jgi:hypothetical protein
MSNKTKTTPPWQWIVGGAALAVGAYFFAVIVENYDLPSRGGGGFWLLLSAIGVGAVIYGVILWLRQRFGRRR